MRLQQSKFTVFTGKQEPLALWPNVKPVMTGGIQKQDKHRGLPVWLVMIISFARCVQVCVTVALYSDGG